MTNTYIPKFTYVIPFRFEADRIIPLRRVVEILSGFQGSEIIVVEQDKYSKISHLNLKVNHLFLKSELPFNKGWAFNAALRRATSPIVICADADFLINPNHLIESLKALEEYECIIPHSKVVKLNGQQSMGELNNIFSVDNPVQKVAMTDGMAIFKKEALLKICGWNEDFLGFGMVNTFQDLKIKKFLNWKELDYVGYHLFHQPEPFDVGLNNRNHQIWDQFKSGDINILNQQIQAAAPRIGNLNKYDI
jgi:glycosyltransferase involved in cell wall biosynthesis